MSQRKLKDSVSIGIVLYQRVTLLDVSGPYEVFARLPGARVALLAATLDPIHTDRGMVIIPDTCFDDAAPDVMFVPGGPGQMDVMEDEEFVGYLRRWGAGAKFVTSVCTGSLLLASAGLLEGRCATTHWLSMDLLARLGVETVAERVVIDGNRITAAGVSAGIDLALVVASRLFGDDAAKEIQLLIEYDPQPPFPGGSIRTAEPRIIDRVSSGRVDLQEERRAQVDRIVERLKRWDRESL